MSAPDIIPNPGSDAAISQGCTCPILDNARGAGWLGGVKCEETGQAIFVYSASCQLHSPVTAIEGRRG